MLLKDDRFVLSGDVDALALCERYGTPLYVYDADLMRNQYDRLKSAFGMLPNFRIHYAAKALTNVSVIKFFKQLGAGLDCVSIEEVRIGLMAGYTPEEILYTPNFASADEFQQAVELGVRITIDNIPMLEHLGMHHQTYPICLRINPHLMGGGNEKISVGHIDSKFGISIHQMPHVLRVVASQHLRIEGLHMHTGSDILDVDIFIRGAEILFEAAEKFPDLRYIDLGSRFKVPYKEDDIETDVEELGQKLCKRFLDFCKGYGRALTLIFEPGKFLVSAAGFFFATCTTVKQTTSTTFVGLNTGLNHLIRPMFYGSYHRISNVTAPTFKPRIYTVVGNICETDTFGNDRRIPEVVEGDVLCFHNAGAYGFMMASNYNSRMRPAEVMIMGGKDYLIRRRETLDDLLSTQIQIPM